jgi:hypothetical protein
MEFDRRALGGLGARDRRVYALASQRAGDLAAADVSARGAPLRA